MIIGIAIDTWKRAIFERRLKSAGFVYDVNPGVTNDTLLITVEAESKDAVLSVVTKANREAAHAKNRKG